jgi:hypothetical protein
MMSSMFGIAAPLVESSLTFAPRIRHRRAAASDDARRVNSTPEDVAFPRWAKSDCGETCRRAHSRQYRIAATTRRR